MVDGSGLREQFNELLRGNDDSSDDVNAIKTDFAIRNILLLKRQDLQLCTSTQAVTILMRLETEAR